MIRNTLLLLHSNYYTFVLSRTFDITKHTLTLHSPSYYRTFLFRYTYTSIVVRSYLLIISLSYLPMLYLQSEHCFFNGHSTTQTRIRYVRYVLSHTCTYTTNFSIHHFLFVFSFYFYFIRSIFSWLSSSYFLLFELIVSFILAVDCVLHIQNFYVSFNRLWLQLHIYLYIRTFIYLYVYLYIDSYFSIHLLTCLFMYLNIT